jgi:transposase-like protein
MRWIARYVPEFEKRWNRFACRVGTSWRVNETDVKIKGRWTYLYRAVDKQGKTVDFLLRAKRDVAAAKAFFRRAFKSQGRLPRAILMVTRLRIGRRGKSSANIGAASGPKYGPRNI